MGRSGGCSGRSARSTSSLARPWMTSAMFISLCSQGRGGEELSAELSSSLQRCLLGGTSGAGAGIDSSSQEMNKKNMEMQEKLDETQLVVQAQAEEIIALKETTKRMEEFMAKFNPSN